MKKWTKYPIIIILGIITFFMAIIVLGSLGEIAGDMVMNDLMIDGVELTQLLFQAGILILIIWGIIKIKNK